MQSYTVVSYEQPIAWLARFSYNVLISQFIGLYQSIVFTLEADKIARTHAHMHASTRTHTHIYSIYGVFILRRLYPDDNERVITTL